MRKVFAGGWAHKRFKSGSSQTIEFSLERRRGQIIATSVATKEWDRGRGKQGGGGKIADVVRVPRLLDGRDGRTPQKLTVKQWNPVI